MNAGELETMRYALRVTTMLWAALEESVKLQGHYAQLLNAHDAGERKIFTTANDWIARLAELGHVTDPRPSLARSPT
jgi:hypothetical protein